MFVSAVESSTAVGTLETRMSCFVQAAMSTWSYPAPVPLVRHWEIPSLSYPSKDFRRMTPLEIFGLLEKNRGSDQEDKDQLATVRDPDDRMQMMGFILLFL